MESEYKSQGSYFLFLYQQESIFSIKQRQYPVLRPGEMGIFIPYSKPLNKLVYEPAITVRISHSYKRSKQIWAPSPYSFEYLL